ncbi:hypothetical protein FACS189472_12630 [Alphaproteobacteria bacterium]|nr:hypothetical protein FACS189472_12630 [Alphaproteobacteria bacterium]
MCSFKLPGNYKTIDNLRTSALASHPHVLITDAGDVLGTFVISNISETQSHFKPDGTPRKIEFSLSLERTSEESTNVTLDPLNFAAMDKINGCRDHPCCWKYYGTSDAVHQVLQANPHLVKFDYVLPRGVQIKLPMLEKQQINREVRLCD